jgi:hypothetical protein
MAVAPYDPLAQVRQRELRLYAGDVQARLTPTAPGQIPANPLPGSAGTTGGQGGLGAREDGWHRAERFQQQAGDGFASSASRWRNFSGGGSGGRPLGGSGSTEIDGRAQLSRPQQPLRMAMPDKASGFERQGVAFDYAASFQEHARDWSRMLGTRR